jgi:7,8-dihydroneopterin aldolase/epimerase/oxygenase
MLDKLFITGLEFYGHCGITDAERQTGQRLSLDLEILCDAAKAAAGDRLENAVDYAAVSRRMVEFASKESCTLIETLAERMADVLLREFGAREVRLRLKKPHPPIEPIMEYAAVEIHRVS